MVAAFTGELEARDHIPTARTGTSERELTFANIVLSIRPEQQMTWGSFYYTNLGIGQVFAAILKNETSFNISEAGRFIGSGDVVSTALVTDWSI